MTPAPPTRNDRPHWRHSLKTRMALWFGASAALLACAAGIALYLAAERRALETAEARMGEGLRATVSETRALLQAVEVSAAALARAQLGVGGDEDTRRALLAATVLSDPHVAGGLVALQAASAPRPGAAWAMYADRRSRDVGWSDLGARDGDVAAQPWFRDGLTASGPRWSPAFFNDTAGGRWMVTLAQPLREPGGAAVGMVSLDVPIDRLNALLMPFRGDRELRAILVKNDRWIGDSTWISIGTPPPTNSAMEALFAERGLGALPGAQVHELLPGLRGAYATVAPGWGVVMLLDEAAVVAPVRAATWRMVAGTLVVILLLALFSNALARRITQPLVALGRAAERLASDGFGMPTGLLTRKDEIGQLARVLDHADAELRQQMARTQRLAKEQQKLDSELRLAHDLQQSMLPPSTSVNVAEGHVDVHALLKPAKSVGGDFYAFHPREDGMLWFAIGDISDKGVPAALFMARTVAVLEATARNTDSPAMMLARAAPRLAEGNESCMFATALCGLLDPHTGLFEMASSGHELPFIVRANGHIELFEMETGAPLGIDPDAYGEGFAGMLAPGDALFCFTDGVTEARNRQGELFGEDRLRQVLKAGRGAALLVADVVAAVEAFAAGAEQADDITVLAVGMVAPEKPAADPLHFSLWPAGLRAMNVAIEQCLADNRVDVEGTSDVRLVLEELIANALDHGGASECSVDLAFTDTTIALEIVDDGTFFDPLDTPELELDENDLDRPIGGLGIHLIKTMALDAAYLRDGDLNRLTLVLPRNPP